MDYYQKNRTINFQYFCVKLSRFWIWIIGSAVFFAVLLPILRYIKLRNTYLSEQKAFEQGIIDAVEPKPISFPFAYIAVGFLMGAILVIFIVFLFDCLNGKLKCSAELDKPNDAQLLAVFKYSEDRKSEIIAKKILHYESAGPIEKEKELLLSRLRITCHNQKIDHLVIAGSITGEKVESILDITEKLLTNGIPSVYIGDILNDPEAILRLNAGDSAVLVVKAGETTYKELDQTIAQLRFQKTKLIGYIMFE